MEKSAMIHLEQELNQIKRLYFEMHALVRSQMTLARRALLNKDEQAASEAMQNESRVNRYELAIDRQCEDFLALHHPVASDLRLAISVLKMAGNLERIGDHAYSVSTFVYNDKISLPDEISEYVSFEELFNVVDEMFANTMAAFETLDAKMAKSILKQDKPLNKANKKTPKLMEKYAKDYPDSSISAIILISRTVGKLERTGDLLKNLAEEIIFYIKSDVIKHKKKNKKIRKKFNIEGDKEGNS